MGFRRKAAGDDGVVGQSVRRLRRDNASLAAGPPQHCIYRHRWGRLSEVDERWRGYCRALRAAGIGPDESLRADAAPSECDGRSAAEMLLERGVEFDGIFAASDVAAIGAMHALQHAGRTVPQDVAVIGFDDIAAASLASPALTTITQDARQAGEALVDTLIQSIETNAAEDRILPVRLMVRAESERRRIAKSLRLRCAVVVSIQ